MQLYHLPKAWYLYGSTVWCPRAGEPRGPASVVGPLPLPHPGLALWAIVSFLALAWAHRRFLHLLSNEMPQHFYT